MSQSIEEAVDELRSLRDYHRKAQAKIVKLEAQVEKQAGRIVRLKQVVAAAKARGVILNSTDETFLFEEKAEMRFSTKLAGGRRLTIRSRGRVVAEVGQPEEHNLPSLLREGVEAARDKIGA